MTPGVLVVTASQLQNGYPGDLPLYSCMITFEINHDGLLVVQEFNLTKQRDHLAHTKFTSPSSNPHSFTSSHPPPPLLALPSPSARIQPDSIQGLLSSSKNFTMSGSYEQPDVLKVSILGKQDAIHIGLHLLDHLAETIVTTLPSSAYAIVTDTVLAKLFLGELQEALQKALHRHGKTNATRLLHYAVQPGEGSKSRNVKAAVEDYLLSERCTRDTVLLALGGGVVGDLSGFVAATFMRGIKYVQIPTTLLSMVDSSVGGKVSSSLFAVVVLLVVVVVMVVVEVSIHQV